jgi:hypothetical protein
MNSKKVRGKSRKAINVCKGRPAGSPVDRTKHVGFYLSQKMYEDAFQLAADNDESLSHMLRRIIDETVKGRRNGKIGI